MNPLHAGSLGVTAALVGALADPATALATDRAAREPLTQPTTEGSAPILDALPSHAAPQPDSAPAEEDCDGKCKVLALTSDVLPGLGASQLLGVLLYPEESGVSISKSDGTPAVTFTIMPGKITRGKGLVAIGRF
jgi:hypothetical protein